MGPLLVQRLKRRFAKRLAFLVDLHLVGAVAYRIIARFSGDCDRSELGRVLELAMAGRSAAQPR